MKESTRSVGEVFFFCFFLYRALATALMFLHSSREAKGEERGRGEEWGRWKGEEWECEISLSPLFFSFFLFLLFCVGFLIVPPKSDQKSATASSGSKNRIAKR